MVKERKRSSTNGELLTETGNDNDDIISRYILGYGVVAGWNKEKRGYHAYHQDEQNGTAYITDQTGIIENSYQYGAFGDIRNSNEVIYNRILYTGQQYDQISGQYYLRARFYNPVVGRFLQEDVYRGDGLNLYAYCADNPVIYYDPSGYSKWDDYRKEKKGLGMSLDEMSADYQENYGGLGSERIYYQDKNGNIFKYSDPRYRPSYDPDQVEKTWNKAIGDDGKVYSSPSETVIEWELGTSRKGIWDMGHKDGHEYIVAYDRYIRQKFDSTDFANNEKLFEEWYRNHENYVPQTPHDNRTNNQKHSTLTQEELEQLGIKRVDKNGNEISSDKC